ncbi:GNAT family N-acetyltransferase [Sphingomonas sp. LB-2]|uniref:GNAT family N-acetyltransferase n=1 Tax=Sphingomonas caeni TaxID=2984949 RepID=UPI0022327D0B|nr:GNAT family N-acetyltransferase [Sphingomonas caeni]MCW3849574.1 GNAT family N-acetyltransferase [Sphingomonas caeni]
MAGTDEQRLALLENQFQLQDFHFRKFFPDTDRRIVTSGGQAIGRFYLLRGPDIWTVIDISLAPPFTGQGIGDALFDEMTAEADSVGRAIMLHCSLTNRAHNFYLRKGFADVRIEGGDYVMERQPQAVRTLFVS